MQRENITVQARKILGKEVRKLRNQDLIPANVYGQGMTSASIQLPLKEFIELYKKVHETGLIDLLLDGQTLPVLIHDISWSPKTHQPNHANFLKVNLREKLTAKIPVISVGEALAVVDKKGMVLQTLSEVEVEALPTDLPEKFEVNIEKLSEVGDQITAEQLTIPSGVTLLTEPAEIVFKIGELVSEEAVEQAAEEAAAAAAAEEEKAVEGEETAEGETEGEKKEEGEADAKDEGKAEDSPKETSKE